MTYTSTAVSGTKYNLQAHDIVKQNGKYYMVGADGKHYEFKIDAPAGTIIVVKTPDGQEQVWIAGDKDKGINDEYVGLKSNLTFLQWGKDQVVRPEFSSDWLYGVSEKNLVDKILSTPGAVVVGTVIATKVELDNATNPFGLSMGSSTAKFGSVQKLEDHFIKHGDEFRGIYNNAGEYLEGAKDVMRNGTKVAYEYKGETRTGYLRFMGNSGKGEAKFEFVGTNSVGEITTYHVESGKSFWKMLNGEVVKVINPLD